MHKEILKVGNNAIEADADFTDGYSNGNLYYYDRNHQRARYSASAGRDKPRCLFVPVHREEQ